MSVWLQNHLNRSGHHPFVAIAAEIRSGMGFWRCGYCRGVLGSSQVNGNILKRRKMLDTLIIIPYYSAPSLLSPHLSTSWLEGPYGML